MELTTLKTADFETKVLENKDISLVYFWQENCGPCAMLHGSLEALPEQPDVKGFSICAQDAHDLTDKYLVLSLPCLLFFKDGELKKKTIGYKSRESILGIIETL